MYKIGVIGHTTEYIPNIDQMKSRLNLVLDKINFQYKGLVFNTSADPGIGEWVIDFCISNETKYHLFLPFPINEMEVLLLEDQNKKLLNHFLHAWATTTHSIKFDAKSITDIFNYKQLIDNSQFIIFFWNGMKQGKIFESIKYALSKNSLSLNGNKELSLITNEDIYGDIR